MARPCKKRWISSQPKCKRFYPVEEEQVQMSAAEYCQTMLSVKSEQNSMHEVKLSLDEYECIRLIDHEGFGQEQCAIQMGVARTTVQSIYKSAREKMADMLVNAKALRIEGGDVAIFVPKGGNIMMRIAVTYENGQIFQHFGHTAQFKVYDIEDGEVVASTVVDTNGNGHGALAGFLFGNKVDVLICGGIGGGAQMALADAGITLYGGVSGDADAAVEALLKQELAYNPNVQCKHHGEGHHRHEGESCASHSCGGHCGTH